MNFILISVFQMPDVPVCNDKSCERRNFSHFIFNDFEIYSTHRFVKNTADIFSNFHIFCFLRQHITIWSNFYGKLNYIIWKYNIKHHYVKGRWKKMSLGNFKKIEWTLTLINLLIFRNDMLHIFNRLSYKHVELLRCHWSLRTVPRPILKYQWNSTSQTSSLLWLVTIARIILLNGDSKAPWKLPFFMPLF